MTDVLTPTPAHIARAAELIKQGGLVAFPTETVYGLGADATNGKAVASIFEVKGRPHFNPLIVHGASINMLECDVEFNDVARTLADTFWPGPLTMILPRREDSKLSDLVSAGLPTVAVRVPNHPVALELIAKSEVPIAAPSANASGEISPTAPHHVQSSLEDKVPLIIAGGACAVGLESTVVDITGEDIIIVRAGAITAEDIISALTSAHHDGNLPIVRYELEATDKPRSPGQLLRHYAPKKPLRLRAIDVAEGEALLAFGSTKFMGLKNGGAVTTLPDDYFKNLSETGDLFEAASHLFAYLRGLDESNATGIAVMDIPNIGIGIAINDRLKRAAEK